MSSIVGSDGNREQIKTASPPPCAPRSSVTDGRWGDADAKPHRHDAVAAHRRHRSSGSVPTATGESQRARADAVRPTERRRGTPTGALPETPDRRPTPEGS